jgi:hypothetical protein
MRYTGETHHPNFDLWWTMARGPRELLLCGKPMRVGDSSCNKIFREMAMKHTKVTHRTARPAGLVQHGFLVALTLAAILVTDPAMAARRGKIDTSADIRPTAAAATVAPKANREVTKPMQRHGRHASKPRAGAR